MDKAQTKVQYLCSKHHDSEIQFLQVENLTENKTDQKLFYCIDCVDEDMNFKPSNYQRIKQIIQSGSNKMLSRWPPTNNSNLLNQLIQQSQGVGEIQQIENYFEMFKRDILQQIENCKKKMINEANNFIENKTQILNKYLSLSKIKELKSIFENNTTDINQKENQYRELLDNILQQKQSITEQLVSLLLHQKQIIFNPELAFSMKESILESIKSISMFEYNEIQQENQNQNYNNKNQLNVQLLSTSFGQGHSKSEIKTNKNNEQEVIITKNCEHTLNTISNIILQTDKKYIFRIEIQMNSQGEHCYIGLMKDMNVNSQWGCNNLLSCTLQNKGEFIAMYSKYNRGIIKLVKGDSFMLSNENQIELRVCIKDQILEVLDYPNYNYKLILDNKFKSNLINHDDLRLYLGMKFLNNKMILKEAFTVDQFE